MKKITAKWATLAVVITLLAAVGCSSTERKEAAVTAPAPQSQTAYTDYASDQLNHWRSQARDLPERDRNRSSAAVRDAQVTLEQLKRSNGDTWRSYRSRMEDSLQNLERVTRQAKNER